MPTNGDDLGQELSSVVNQTSAQIQNLKSTMDGVYQKLDKVADAMQEFAQGAKDGGAAMAAQARVTDALLQSALKINEAKKKELESTQKIAALEKEIDKVQDNKRKGDARKKNEINDINSKIKAEKEYQRELKKTVEIEINGQKEVKRATGRGGGGGGGRRGGGFYNNAMEIASDANLPGASSVATVGKYAMRGSQVGEGVGGLAGGVGRMLGGAAGALGGAAVLGAGYTAYQGYKAYNTAHEMAPLARTLRGQGNSVADRQSAVGAYGGYGGVENMQMLSGLNRQLGGRGGMANLKGATDNANQFGISREEAGQGAGALMRAGGSSPQAASKDLKSIMIEGVKGGMDRARITEYTQQVVGLQEDVFKATGSNGAKGIAETISQMMRASGRKDNFLGGPEMQGMRGLDAAIKGSTKGGGNATIMRALGFGQGGGSMGANLYQTTKESEKGLFGAGSGKEQVGRMNKIFDQYMKESGGKKEVALMRMHQDTGVGLTQLEKLDNIRKKGDKVGGDDLKELKKIQEEAKDPMEKLLDIQAKMDANLAKMAGGEHGLAAVVRIDEAIKKAQENALDVLEDIADLLDPASKDSEVTGAIKDLAKILIPVVGGIAALSMLKSVITGGGKATGAMDAVEGVAGKAGKWGMGKAGGLLASGRGLLAAGAGAVPEIGGLLTANVGSIAGGAGAAGVAGAVGLVGAAGAAGYGVGKYIANPLIDKVSTKENKYGQKSNAVERGMGQVASMLPSWMGGISEKQRADMYDDATPAESAANAARAADGSGGGGGAPGVDPSTNEVLKTLAKSNDLQAETNKILREKLKPQAARGPIK